MPDNDSRNDDLRQWLHRGDPASGDTDLTLEETRLMRQRILATAREARRPRFVPLAALAGAAALAAVLLLRPAPVTMESSTTVRPSVAERSEHTARQVQFTTESGTRIVWTLDPEFEL